MCPCHINNLGVIAARQHGCPKVTHVAGNPFAPSSRINELFHLPPVDETNIDCIQIIS